MSLVYRAIWQDDREHLCERVQEAFKDWVSIKSNGQLSVDRPGSDRAHIELMGKPAEIDVQSELAESTLSGRLLAVRSSYVITNHRNERWHTTLRSWTDPSGSGWVWVDNAVVGDLVDPQRLQIAAPKVVRNLLSDGICPRVGETPISGVPQDFNGFAAGKS
ncbi:MAG: hypothetical protein EON54_23800 [Alcaligenaceae bacterium]|nr:MAG: hypothetical protein EON54_23800 [Alcaligenaceae bacterium]